MGHPSFDFQPVLSNELVTIRPLAANDHDALFAIASDPLLWEQHPAKERSTPEGFRTFFDDAMAAGTAFLISDAATGEVVGTSRYSGFSDTSRIEIGWTFIGRKFWGGLYNRSVKELMLDHAFRFVDEVVFVIDRENFRSQRAVMKLGALRILDLAAAGIAGRSERAVGFTLSKGTRSSLR